MNPVKSKTAHCLIVSLILMVGYLTSVTAVTDAELEALEKQIEQLEAEEKKQAEVEEIKKAKAESKLKTKAETEAKLRAEAEEKRLAKLGLQRLEEEIKKKAKEEKKVIYDSTITEARKAIKEYEKDLAISKFNEILVLYPEDKTAVDGIKEAQQLMDKMCYEVLGLWIHDSIISHTIDIKVDGTVEGGGFKQWECLNPKDRIINISSFGGKHQLSNDGSCLLKFSNSNCYRRPDYKSKDDEPKKPKRLIDAIQ